MDGTRVARRRRWSWAGRIVLAGVLLAIAWPTSLNELAVTPATALPVALVVALPVLVAPEHPWRAWGASALGALLIALLVGPAPGHAGGVQAVHLVVLCGLTALVVGRCAPWAAAVAAVGLAGAFVLATGAAPEGFGLAVFWTALVLAVGLLLRRVLTQRREIAVVEELRADEESRRAVLQERARVARDLHDVVAHSMSMVVVRAETARYRLPAVDEASAAEFSAVADVARQALTELRGVLDVLRTDDESRHLAPQPTVADVDTLLAATSDAGVDLAVTTTGDPASTGPAAALSTYRILAEALANASRHAAGAPVAVTLDHGPEAVHVRVVNGPGRDATGPGSGLGLPGMRERAAAVGGELTVGPTDDGGFAVDARLPVGRAVGVAP